MAENKRIATNSMLVTGRRCFEKYALRYVDCLVPAKTGKAVSFGSLFHELVKGLWVDGGDFSYIQAIEDWRLEKIEAARQQAEQVKQRFGIEDQGIVGSVEEQCSKTASGCVELFTHYRDDVWQYEVERYKPLFVEQTFSVPMLTRACVRHPVWRYSGKFDIVLLDQDTDEVIVRDYKTTTRYPADFASMLELDTQPISYFFASLYLQTHRGKDERDYPQWPEGLPPVRGFELEVIRKKVPKEPPLLKSGRLSKAQNIDTTVELFREAIHRHHLIEDDYVDVIERLKKRGPAFHLRHRVAVGPEEIKRWVNETRQTLEHLREIELHRDRAYRTEPMSCQNQYGRRCEYHPLCYGDWDSSIVDFITKKPHAELDPGEGSKWRLAREWENKGSACGGLQ